MCIFLFLSAVVIFSTLIKKYVKKIKFKKKLKITNFQATQVSFFAQKLLIIIFFINDFFAQITFSCSL